MGNAGFGRKPAQIIRGADPLVRAGPPWTRSSLEESVVCNRQQADQGVGRGPGGPPHNLCRIQLRFRHPEVRLHLAKREHQPVRRNCQAEETGLQLQR